MRYYPSKLLLFGEYILLLGARALATPVPAFRGQWATAAPTQQPDFIQALTAFAQSTQLKELPGMDPQRFLADIQGGLYFESDIPPGYGLGSSGALCAAVYDRYVQPKTTDLSRLKQVFAEMESFFHGQSSGIDPLTSYLNRSLWIINRTEVSFFTSPEWQNDAPVIFLLDTGIPRQTAPLVQWFLDQSEHPEFSAQLKQDLMPAHNTMLEAWETADTAAFWDALRGVSAFQSRNMQPMIPPAFQHLWETCLAGQDCLLKICGAGGGGFILGFARDRKYVSELGSTYALTFPFEQHGMVEK